MSKIIKMDITRKLLVFTALYVLFSISSIISGQPNEVSLLKEFFIEYKESKSKALQNIYATNKWIDQESEDFKSLLNQIRHTTGQLGHYIKEEKVHNVQFTSSYSIYTYLVKYERQPLRFTFTFYKPESKWVLYSFQFDDDFDNDFEEIAKFQYGLGNGY